MSFYPDPIKNSRKFDEFLLKYPVKESFRWLTDEFNTNSYGKHSIKIKGVALRSNIVSRNNRKYIDEELVQSARTFVGKPVTINHRDPYYKDNVVGTVDWMQYEDGVMEYLATIKKEPYVRMLRDKSTDIKGVSIEAMYLTNKCPQCGRKFNSEDQFRNHMKEEHFMDVSESVIHGMVGTALSLVLAPEECGVPSTTIELMETYNKLFEMIVTEKGGKYEEMIENEEIIEEPTEKTGEELKETQHTDIVSYACKLGEVYNPLSCQCEPAQVVSGKLTEIFMQCNKTQMQRLYHQILDYADHVVAETREHFKGEQGLLRVVDRLADLLNHVSEISLKALDTKSLRVAEMQTSTINYEKLQERMQTLEENFQYIQRGTFKGKAPELKTKEERRLTVDPMTGRRL